MAKITVDGTTYQTDDLTDNAKAQLASLQFLEVQIRKLRDEISIFKTAREAYKASLGRGLRDSAALAVTSDNSSI